MSIAQVEHIDVFMALPNAVNAANALFNLHWVPWQVEVDQPIRSLEVQTFCCRISAHQDVDLAAQEPLLHVISVDADEPFGLRVSILSALTGIGANEHAGVDMPQPGDDVGQCVEKPRKDDGLPYPSSAVDTALLQRIEQDLHLRGRTTEVFERHQHRRQTTSLPCQIVGRTVLQHRSDNVFVVFIVFSGQPGLKVNLCWIV